MFTSECCARTNTYAEEDGQFGNEIRGGAYDYGERREGEGYETGTEFS